jgi:glycosyltransferase involved in cell wall biosynthesis
MNNIPLISIITIVFNGEKYIEETIKSVISQDKINLEYIIIDGGSTDNTISIVNKYLDKISLFISEPDKGIYDAINKGISHSNGILVGLIHCGDYYSPNVLEKVMVTFQKSNADIVYGNQIIIEEYNNELIERFNNGDHTKLKYGMTIPHPSTFVSKSCYDKYGYYSINFKISSDYSYFLTLYIANLKFIKIDEVLAYFRAGGVSSRNLTLSIKPLSSILLLTIGAIKPSAPDSSNGFIQSLECDTGLGKHGTL